MEEPLPIRRPVTRRLPPTPVKPSTLPIPRQNYPVLPHVYPSPTVPLPHRSPGHMNLPHVNASPTHYPMPVNPMMQRPVMPPMSNRPIPISPTETAAPQVDWQRRPPHLANNRRAGSHDLLEYPDPRAAADLPRSYSGQLGPIQARHRNSRDRFYDPNLQGSATLPNGFKPPHSQPKPRRSDPRYYEDPYDRDFWA